MHSVTVKCTVVLTKLDTPINSLQTSLALYCCDIEAGFEVQLEPQDRFVYLPHGGLLGMLHVHFLHGSD